MRGTQQTVTRNTAGALESIRTGLPLSQAYREQGGHPGAITGIYRDDGAIRQSKRQGGQENALSWLTDGARKVR
jgi:hypothetical protein